MDNVRQVLRVVVLLAVSLFGHDVGFFGVLGGLALAEFLGMIFMSFAIARTFEGLTVRMLVPDTARLGMATLLIVSVGTIAANLPITWGASGSFLAGLRLAMLSLATVVAAWPALRLTGSLSRSEVCAMMQSHKGEG